MITPTSVRLALTASDLRGPRSLCLGQRASIRARVRVKRAVLAVQVALVLLCPFRVPRPAHAARLRLTQRAACANAAHLG